MKTQNQIVLNMLKRFRRKWVAMPTLAILAGAYAIHSRIADLRRAGWNIDNRVEGIRPRKSFYRLN